MKPLPEDDFKKIIEGAAETTNLEFKAGFDFDDNLKEREKVIRAIFAMSNTRNGGDIVVGINDQKSSNDQFEGLKIELFEKFQNKLEDLKSQVEKYSSSPIPYEMYEAIFNKQNYILIRVPEFEYLPIICKQTSQKHPDGKIVLEIGAIYFRTSRDKPSSVKIADVNDMNDLIRRATAKEIEHRHNERWLHQVEITPNIRESFNKERGSGM